MKMRAPALPIVNIDPYFSVWAQESPLEHLVHWTGSFNTMVGIVTVDGEEYRFLGILKEVKAGSKHVLDLSTAWRQYLKTIASRSCWQDCFFRYSGHLHENQLMIL